MNLPLKTSVVCFSLYLSALTQGCAAGNFLVDSLNQAEVVRLRFSNPDHSFRTIYGVGDINSNRVDYAVTVDCGGNCAKNLVTLPGLLASAQESTKSCFSPPYARLDLLRRDSDKAFLELYFDHTGQCISVDNKTYSVSKPVALTLHRIPLRDW